jgi:two-component system sensor histidine kinase DegS
MYDNNEINIQENSKEQSNDQPLNDDVRSYGEILRDMVFELEEQLYSNKVLLKTQNDLLNEKEQELSERERTKAHNIDLFTPLYNKTYDIQELLSEIQIIKLKIDDLDSKNQQISTKLEALRASAKIVDNYELIKSNETIEHNNNVNKIKINDKGLSILEAQEIERQRIARDLHDSTVQNLTSLVHKSELCVKLIDIDSIRAKLELNAMSNTVKMIINEMRDIIYNLKPMSLDDLGLSITVERYANRLTDFNNIDVVVHSNEETKEILPVIKLTIFRIIQEACNNVIKHAKASIINIDINYREKDITVIIKDDGCGFSLNDKPSDESDHCSSFGLSIMKERISLLSGTVEIQSVREMGTIVTITAPLTLREGDKDE